MNSHQILARHILSPIARIEQYTVGMSEKEFLDNFLVQDGVMRNIEVIAEASKKFSTDIKNRFPDIPWRQIMAMRNKIIHEYFGIDLQAVWIVVKEDLNQLKPKIESIKNLS